MGSAGRGTDVDVSVGIVEGGAVVLGVVDATSDGDVVGVPGAVTGGTVTVSPVGMIVVAVPGAAEVVGTYLIHT